MHSMPYGIDYCQLKKVVVLWWDYRQNVGIAVYKILLNIIN